MSTPCGIKLRLDRLGEWTVQFKQETDSDVGEWSPEAASLGEPLSVLPFKSQRWVGQMPSKGPFGTQVDTQKEKHCQPQ